MKKVLIIDDDKQLLKTLSKVFRMLKYDVVSAASVDEAWNIILNAPPNLIVSDYFFKENNVCDLLSKLKMNVTDFNIPVVVLTGYTEESIKNLCGAKGAAAFLTKPFRINELKDVINSINSGE